MSSTSSLSPWEVLGVERGASVDTVRRAYARKLRGASPEDDPAGFMALRQALDAALRSQASAVSGLGSVVIEVEPPLAGASDDKRGPPAVPSPVAERRGASSSPTASPSC